VTLLQACEWLGHSSIGTAIRTSKWGFALIEMVHLLALALFGGTLLVSALHSSGVIFKGSPPGSIARDLGAAQLASLLAMIVSGILLFADGPLRYYGNTAFRVKLLLIAAAVPTGLLSRFRGEARFATLVSFTLWVGASVAGRVIGVL
jgi:hypothetical protein